MSNEIVSKSWESLGYLEPASEKDISEVLPNFAGPVCVGTLKQIRDLTPAQISSPEVWETINSVNIEVLTAQGFSEDEIELIDADFLVDN